MPVSEPIALLIQFAGVALIALAVADVYMTVLYARAGTGPLSHRLASWGWAVARRVGRAVPGHKGGLLAAFGPTYVVVLISSWVSLLLLGFTLITWPRMGTGIQSTSGPTPTDFFTAFHFAGGSLTTVGSSELRPATAFFRFLTVVDSVIGMTVLTLSVSYVIQIYTALQRRNALCLSLHHASGGTGDAAALLASLGPGDDFTRGDSVLASLAAETSAVYESHHFYSVLIYFRFRDPYYAMSRGALTNLEMISLIDTALDDGRHGWLRRTAAVTQIREGGMHVLTEFAGVYLPGGPPSTGEQSPAVEAQWRRRFAAALQHLRRCGISVTRDVEQASDRYVELRRRWDPYVMAFARYMEHEPAQIDPPGAEPSVTARHREMPEPPLQATG
jgi:hypothetical protein